MELHVLTEYTFSDCYSLLYMPFSILWCIAACGNLVYFECSLCLFVFVCLKAKYIYIPSEYRTYS